VATSSSPATATQAIAASTVRISGLNRPDTNVPVERGRRTPRKYGLPRHSRHGFNVLTWNELPTKITWTMRPPRAPGALALDAPRRRFRHSFKSRSVFHVALAHIADGVLHITFIIFFRAHGRPAGIEKVRQTAGRGCCDAVSTYATCEARRRGLRRTSRAVRASRFRCNSCLKCVNCQRAPRFCYHCVTSEWPGQGVQIARTDCYTDLRAAATPQFLP
jgi:hypothetical protein